jgi:hypothetical protein
MSSQAENQAPKGSSVVKPLMGHRWYVYGNTKIDEHGKKAPLFPIREKISDWRSCSHIQTILTAADGSSLVYGVALDFDYKDADDRWKAKGKLDHNRIKAFIDELYPVLGRYLCTWTRSTGGRGLGAILFFDPFILRHEKTGGVTFLAERVQRLIIRVLSSHGLGCDEHAAGIVRFTPNWRNPRILLHKDEVTIRRVQRENEPHQVLSRVYNELRRAKVLKPKTKKDEVAAGVRFAVKDSADEGLAKIYAHILDSEPETLTITSNYDALMRISGLSTPTLRQHLKNAPWIDLKRAYGEGLCLSLKPSAELSERAYGEIRNQGKKPSTFSLSSREDWLLPDPEFVGDDERNNFLWRRAVLLRNEGYPLSEAISLIRDESKRIPGAKESRNCRKVENIVGSIFRHLRQGSKPKRKIFSLEALTKSQSYCEAELPQNTCLNATKEQPQGDYVPEAPLYCPAAFPTVDESSTSKEGGSGDLPPALTSDAELLAWISDFVPDFSTLSARKPVTGAVVLKMEAFTMPSRNDGSGPGNSKPFRTIRDARAAVCRNRHPLDRLARAIDRVLARSSEEEVLFVLRTEHEKLCRTKDKCLRYTPPEGKFKRLCEAWSLVGPGMRIEFLE